jgi:hypothetical protein
MQEMKYAELEDRALVVGNDDVLKQLEAKALVHQEIEKMKASGEALVLTEEEMAMLASFRRYKSTLTNQGKFKWTTKPETSVTLAPEQSLIVHPSEVA